jgi:OOP family OmpA-OmpF porin
MHKSFLSILGAILLFAGFATAQAAGGRFYDPSNGGPDEFTRGHELFRTIGCPGRELLGKPCEVVDSDGDGVFDYRDKCPNTPAGRKVNADGCELDSDGDGIVDGEDDCPTVYAKTANGCPPPAAAAPEPAPAPVMPELKGAHFDFDKASVRQEDFMNLDQDVATLKQWGDVKVEVGGHTDSIGSAEYNQGLSLRRAEAVRTYLIDKGIAADRLSAKGYGESQPVGDNATEAGRFQNRRVELVPQK